MIRLDNGPISIDSFAKSTHFEAVFGKGDCLLTGPFNPGFKRILSYSHGGLYRLSGKRIVRDQGRTTSLIKRAAFGTGYYCCYHTVQTNRPDKSNLVLTLKM